MTVTSTQLAKHAFLLAAITLWSAISSQHAEIILHIHNEDAVVVRSTSSRTLQTS